MAATPVGDLFDKYAYSNSPVKIYEFVQGQVGLQNIRTTVAGGYVGIFDSWIVRNNNLFLAFYPTLQDKQNFRNPLYVDYAEVNKLLFPGVPTWKRQGIDFTAVSTYVQQIIDNMNTNLGSGIELITLWNKIKKYAPIILIGYVGITLLPSIIQSIKNISEKK
jgi:hypothetical protein